MEGLINLPLFLLSSVLIIIAPGPDFIYVTTDDFIYVMEVD